MKKRVLEYDFLRVALTLLVVLGHAAYTQETTPAGGVDWLPAEGFHPLYFQLREVMQALSTWIYRWHMPAFMALSGAVYRLSSVGDFDRMALGKARRLLGPFLACGLLFMLPVKLWAGFYSFATLREAVFGFFMGTESGHLWFLAGLFWCFVLFWPIRRFIADKYPIGGLFAAIVATQLLRLIDMPYFELLHGAEYLGWFAAGFAFAAAKDAIDGWLFRSRGVAWLCFGALAAVSIGNEFALVLPKVFIVVVNWMLLYILAGLWARRRAAKAGQAATGRVFGLLLSYAFPIYLYHDPLNYVALRLAFGSGLLLSPAGVVAYYLARSLGLVVAGVAIGWVVRAALKKLRPARAAA